LTINLETPESWLVEPVMALHDLDNLLLEAVPEQVAFAEYELEAVVLTGSCNEVLANGRRAVSGEAGAGAGAGVGLRVTSIARRMARMPGC
jgi:hypothetical protein